MYNIYFIKDLTRQEIITKTLIPNKGNYNIYANYYNLLDVKGLGFQINSTTDFEVEKLYRKNGFEYFILEHQNQKELYILPNENIVDYTDRVIPKLGKCRNDIDAIKILINEMY